jgi:hypothetical protein
LSLNNWTRLKSATSFPDRLEFREASGRQATSSADADADNDWIVINIPAPRSDVSRGATATTTLPVNHEVDDDEVEELVFSGFV